MITSYIIRFIDYLYSLSFNSYKVLMFLDTASKTEVQKSNCLYMESNGAKVSFWARTLSLISFCTCSYKGNICNQTCKFLKIYLDLLE